MEILQTPEFVKQLEILLKKKYTNVYGKVRDEIKSFFTEYAEFDQVWNKSYCLFEVTNVRVNKVRLENPLQNSGKSGGFRMIILCEKATKSITLLSIYPKTGPHGIDSISLDSSKKLVKNYKKYKESGLVKKYIL